jgi:hypothetical protein
VVHHRGVLAGVLAVLLPGVLILGVLIIRVLVLAVRVEVGVGVRDARWMVPKQENNEFVEYKQ